MLSEFEQTSRAGAPKRGRSDEQLVAAARRGDEMAFAAIVERYRSPLLGHCRRVAGSASAQDALQQAFLSAWRALRSGCDVHDLRRWLFTIAHRSAVHISREERERSRPLPVAPAETRTPLEDIELGLRTRETLAAIAALPPRERDALAWTAVEGLSGREAARALGVSESALRQLVFRARAHARKALPALLPPALVNRLSGGVRRLTAFVATTSPSTSAPETGALLLKVSAVAAAGLLATMQLAAWRGERGHRPDAPRGAGETRRAPHLVAAAPASPSSRVRSPARAPARGRGARYAARRDSTSPSSRNREAAVPDGAAPAVAADATAVARRRPTEGASQGSSESRGASATPTPVVEQHVDGPVRQLTASVGQVATPVRQVTHVVLGTVTQLPGTIAGAASGTAESGAQQLETVTSDVTQAADDTVNGVLAPSAGSAPLAPIEALVR